MAAKTGDKMAIFLNSRCDKHRSFTNRSRHAINVGGDMWPTVDHYIAAQRFSCPELREHVRESDYAFEAKVLARKYPEKLRTDWEDVRESLMEEALRAKFSAHSDLASELASTGSEEIIDATPCSSFWGAGMAGTGLNKLGQLLMKVRKELQSGGYEPRHWLDAAI